jgi:hypothetical protein
MMGTHIVGCIAQEEWGKRKSNFLTTHKIEGFVRCVKTCGKKYTNLLEKNHGAWNERDYGEYV